MPVASLDLTHIITTRQTHPLCCCTQSGSITLTLTLTLSGSIPRERPSAAGRARPVRRRRKRMGAMPPGGTESHRGRTTRGARLRGGDGVADSRDTLGGAQHWHCVLLWGGSDPQSNGALQRHHRLGRPSACGRSSRAGVTAAPFMPPGYGCGRGVLVMTSRRSTRAPGPPQTGRAARASLGEEFNVK